MPARERVDCVGRVFRCISKAVSWLPIIFVTAFILWVYYVGVFVVMIFQGPGLPDKPIPVRVILLLGGHVLLVLLFATYVRAIFARHKPVSKQFHLPDTLVDNHSSESSKSPEEAWLEGVARSLPVFTVSSHGSGGGVRWCRQCRLVKPDRCHHCSSCGQCVLKMDHHCPWVNNCVGYSNYKFFLLFLFYTVATCAYIMIATSYDFVSIWHNFTFTDTPNGTSYSQFEFYWARINLVFMELLLLCFGCSTAFLLCFHIYLVSTNKTTIENMEPVRLMDGKARSLYNLGLRDNLRQVFGSNLLLAFLPVFTSEGDGEEFRMRRSKADLEEVRARRSTLRAPAPAPAPDDTEDEASETQPLQQQQQH